MFVQPAINDIFDALNSRVLYNHNPHRSALSEKNILVKYTLQDAIHFFNNCKIYNSKGEIRKNIYCFNGMVQTINGILNLFDDVKDEYSFILTSRLQQDALENQFSVIRSKGGYNANPTARQFRQALQQCMHIRILDAIGTSGNCETDDAETLDVQIPHTEINVHSDSENFNLSRDSEAGSDVIIGVGANVQETEVLEINENMSSFEKCSFVYFIGYLVHLCFKKYICVTCNIELQKKDELLIDENEIFLVLKDYGKPGEITYLVRPSEKLLSIMSDVLEVFQTVYNSQKHETHFTKTMTKKILAYVNAKYLKWLDTPKECNEHKMFILQKFIKIKTLKTLTWETNKIHDNKSNSKRKINILKNL